MLHAWGSLSRQFPYTWCGFRIPDERVRELRFPPYPITWDPLQVPEIRAAFERPHELDTEPEPWAPPANAVPISADGDPYLAELAAPAPGNHNRALGHLAATLKGRYYTVADAIAWVVAHWRPRGCDDPEHTDPERVAAHVRRVFRSSYVRRAKWTPPAFVEPTDGTAPILLPGMASTPRKPYCGERRYRFHRRGGSYDVIPYRASCNDDLCPTDYARIAHRSAVAVVEDLARLLHAPEAATARDTALGEFDPTVDEGGRGRRTRAPRPADRFQDGEAWKTRPVRLVVTPPKGIRVTSVGDFRRLRVACEESARSQGFLVQRVVLHDRPGTDDIKGLCPADGWHAEIIGAFRDNGYKANGDDWEEPQSGTHYRYVPINGPVLPIVRSIRMTAARVVDTVEKAKLALALGGGDAEEPGDGGSGGKRGKPTLVRVEAITACHDLCPPGDPHPTPPEPARWCPLCPADEAWIPRPDWHRCTWKGQDRPPDRPIPVDHDAFERDWIVETPGWFRDPILRHGRASGFDQAVYEENYGWET
jgi:hypothetical protein